MEYLIIQISRIIFLAILLLDLGLTNIVSVPSFLNPLKCPQKSIIGFREKKINLQTLCYHSITRSVTLHQFVSKFRRHVIKYYWIWQVIYWRLHACRKMASFVIFSQNRTDTVSATVLHYAQEYSISIQKDCPDGSKMADLLSRNLTLSTENLAPPGGKFKIGNFVLQLQLQ